MRVRAFVHCAGICWGKEEVHSGQLLFSIIYLSIGALEENKTIIQNKLMGYSICVVLRNGVLCSQLTATRALIPQDSFGSDAALGYYSLPIVEGCQRQSFCAAGALWSIHRAANLPLAVHNMYIETLLADMATLVAVACKG